MLYELNVRDMALISRANLEFGEGLHILTGETGAGKSLLLGSVSLALGGKGDPDIIRRGADSAVAQLCFHPDPDTADSLKELDICPDEDGNLILTRSISPRRGSCHINGSAVPLSKLKEAASCLIDIHGQHEHQSLLKKTNHIRLLDGYIAGRLQDVSAKLESAYDRYMKAVRELEEADVDERARERELSLIKHELSEIRGAGLKPGEDEELEKREAVMSHSRKISEAVSVSMSMVSSGSEASDGVSKAIREIQSVSDYDSGLSEICDTLMRAEEALTEASSLLRDYAFAMEFDEGELYEVEKRLDLINTLKHKYGGSIEEILGYADAQEKRQEKLLDYEGYLEGLKKSVSRFREELEQLCDEATKIREKGALLLEEAVTAELCQLNFLDVRFKVEISRLSDFTRRGWDEVEFRISMNPGEPLRSLSQVASGGELSRIMLALRMVSALKDGIDTLIFDEIDSGISGVTAGMVARKLSDLARDRQVICITHLPQIAAYADRHYRIEKSAEGDETTTRVTPIEGEESLSELVRLLGGTSSAKDTALELKGEAQEYKKHSREQK